MRNGTDVMPTEPGDNKAPMLGNASGLFFLSDQDQVVPVDQLVIIDVAQDIGNPG